MVADISYFALVQTEFQYLLLQDLFEAFFYKKRKRNRYADLVIIFIFKSRIVMKR